VVGGLLGGLVIWVVASSVSGFDAEASGFASNGFGDHSPGGFGLGAVILTEVVFTALFVFVVASTGRRSMPAGFTGVTVGLMLTLVHLVTIPVSNTSVNPARSLATAVFQGGWALEQLWVFIVFPIVGGVLGAAVWKGLASAGDH
jgi:aquaporin Z